jgi:hypothetical protein
MNFRAKLGFDPVRVLVLPNSESFLFFVTEIAALVTRFWSENE